MTDMNQQSSIDQTVMLLRIIVGALIMGVVTFSVVAFVVHSGEEHDVEGWGFFSIAAIANTFFVFILRSVFSSLITRAAENKAEFQDIPQEERFEKLLGLFKTKTIIEAALPEGGAFLVLIVFMVEHQLWVLGLLVPLLGMMLLTFPSRHKVEHWVENKLNHFSYDDM